MEFALSEALPNLSGELGNVARGPLQGRERSRHRAGGLGLLHQQEYFRQSMDADGAQRALYPCNDPGQLSVTPVRGNDGEWVRLTIALPGHMLWLPCGGPGRPGDTVFLSTG